MPSSTKTSWTFFLQLAAPRSKFFTLFICLYKMSSKAWDGGKYSFLSDIFRATFHSVLAVLGNTLHSFHISCPCYFLCSFIWLSNELMVFQLHSAAVQRAGCVTGNIWCNLCVDKWEAEFPGCKAYGHNSVWAGPGRAPFFGCQVARGQACGGAAQSAPSNWNVDQSAGTAPCLILSHRSTHSYAHVYMSTHTEWSTSFCVFS